MKVYVLHTLQVIQVMMKSNEVLVVSQEDAAPIKPMQNHQCVLDRDAAIWGLWCQKQVYMAWIVIAAHSIQWGIITYVAL